MSGGAITYGRRYGLGMALGIATEDDKDGNEEGEKTKKKEVREMPDLPPSVIDDIFSTATAAPVPTTNTIESLRKKIWAKAKEAKIDADQTKEYSTITLQKPSSKDWNIEDCEMVLEWIEYKRSKN